VSNRFQFRSYRRHQLLRSLAAGLVTAAVGLALIFTPLGADFERTVGLRLLFKYRVARQPPPEIAVVAISNETGKALDLPKEPVLWPRAIHAPLIERLLEHNPRGIVFDLYFGDPKPGDDIFSHAIAHADRVVLFEWLDPGQEGGEPKPPTEEFAKAAKALGPFTLAKTDQATFQFWAFKPRRDDARGDATPTTAAIAVQLEALPAYADWLAVLKEAGAGAAAARLPTRPEEIKGAEDMQQLMRKLRQMFKEDASLQARVERVLARDDQRLVIGTRKLLMALASLYGGPNDYYINFYGPPGTIRTIPYELLLTNKVQYENKIGGSFQRGETLTFANPAGTAYLSELFDLGTTGSLKFRMRTGSPPVDHSTITGGTSGASAEADGAAVSSEDLRLTNNMMFVGRLDLRNPDHPDRFYTSFTTKDAIDLSGVEIMATAYANLLTQRTLLPPDTLISALSVLAFGLIVGVLVYLLPAAMAVPGAFVLTLLYGLALEWRFTEADLWLPLATPIFVQLPLALLIGLMGQYLLERRKERQLAQAIRYYLPENVVRDLSETQVDPTTLNRVVFGTCLATDMSDFIALAESKSPQELAVFMNEYFDALAQALKRHAVDVMEFRADMIMCAWIEPTRSPAICRKGMEAAIEVSEIIAHFAEQHGSRHFNPRIGLHDGEVYVGHTGGGGHFLYSIVGDAANTAARLESLNKHLGTHVLAAESVVKDSDGLLLRPLGSFRLKGKAESTSIFEILGRAHSARAEQLDLCTKFAEGLATFQRKEWSRAAGLFEAITQDFVDDGPSRFYWACCQRYAAEAQGYEGPAVVQMYEK
jgi:adenylate cyclase